MESKNIVIFCQAPADIPFVLTLYEQYKEVNKVSIFVINVEGMFQFLSNLKLDLELLVFIPYKILNIKQVWLINSERIRISNIWDKYFSNIQNGIVYFFSRFEDWLTGSFIHKFSKKNKIKIIYLDHYDDSANLFFNQKNIPVKSRIYLSILYILTGVNFKARIMEKLPEFPVNKYPIIKQTGIINKKVFAKYSFHFTLPNKNKSNVLFFVSPCDVTIFNPIYYNDTLKEFIILLKNIGFNIIVKGHPRIGIPQTICEIADLEIPSYIPAEFIDMQNIRMCIGLDTTAICHFAKNDILPTYSIIKLFPSANNKMLEILVKYLKQQSDNKILFFENQEQIKTFALKNLK